MGKIKVALIALVLSVSTFAEINEFCSNPQKVVCEDTRATRRERRNKLYQLSRQIYEEADTRYDIWLEEMERKDEELLRNSNGVRGMATRILTFLNWVGSPSKRDVFLLEVAEEKIAGFEKNYINKSMVDKVKSQLKQAIDDSNLKSIQKVNLSRIITDAEVGSFADYNRRIDAKDSNWARKYRSHCGLNGLVENAFATQVDGNDYVLICPGFLFSLNEKESEADKLSVVTDVLAHELSHFIDSREYPNIYKKMSKCYVDNFAKDFNRNAEDVIFCGTSTEEDCLKRVTESHMGEIVADTWAASVVAKSVNANKLNYASSVNFIVQSVIDLCGTSDEGVHPSGKFRINNIIGAAPSILQTLGCGAMPEGRDIWCGLHGGTYQL